MKERLRLDQLPNETIHEIVDHLCIKDPLKLIEEEFPLNKWITPLTICNKRLRRVTLPRLYRTISIFSMKQIDGLLLRVITMPEFAPFIKHLTIHEDSGAVCTFSYLLSLTHEEYSNKGLGSA
jgi:hypothetical protein